MTPQQLGALARERDPRRPGPVVHWTPRSFPWRVLVMLAVLSLLLASMCAGQVAPTIELRAGQITSTIVRNPSPLETLTITVELRERLVAGGQVTVGRAINALVAPTSFTLAPGETQTVRLRLREVVTPGTTLAYVVTFTPSLADVPAPGSETTAVARLVLATRIVAKATVAP